MAGEGGSSHCGVPQTTAASSLKQTKYIAAENSIFSDA
jgi:hypothetical protein